MPRDSFEMKKELSRGSSLFGNDQEKLKTALLKNDLSTFKKIVDKRSADLEFIYDDPDNKTILEIAICTPKRNEFVKHLLRNGVQVNNVNELHGAGPIHFAVKKENIVALKALLEDDRIDVNLKGNSKTALIIAMDKIDELEEDEEDEFKLYEEMVEELLKAGCNAFAPDKRGVTPICSAAKQGLERVVTWILKYNKDPVDIDTYRDSSGRNARDYLKDAFPHLEPEFGQSAPEADKVNVDSLFYCLTRNEEDFFVRDFTKLATANDHRPALAANNGTGTMLQISTDKGFEKAVQTLLKFKADPNAICTSNSNRPVVIACQNGYPKVLQMLIENESTLLNPVDDESLLQITIKGMNSYSNSPKTNYEKCFKLFFEHPKLKNSIDINYLDEKGNTALHYAARNRDNDIVLELLRAGAFISPRNTFNEPPLADIKANTLETYLDECITTNAERPSNDDYEIRYNYSFLGYPNQRQDNEPCEEPLMDNTNNNVKESEVILAPETDALLYMAQNEELRPLLKHPVITSFLYLKWQRISCLFYANLTFYSLLWLCLTLYIILGYGRERKQFEYIEVLNLVTYVVAVIGLLVLISRELFQLAVSPTRYLQNIENWMEIALIVVTVWIISFDSANESTKQQLSAIAILLSSAELVLLIGQFPTLSTNIVMLKTVSTNFFKFLLWYCILIIAFALSFYTLFRHEKVEDQNAPNPNETGKEDDEEDFFEDPGRSLFKTIVMLTGEFDASSIKFSTFPVTSHIIFIIFVFMIPIVLFNLLNGLAVSDTQEIRADAELVGHISRVKLISYFESVLIGRAYSKTSKFWLWLPGNIRNSSFIRPGMFFIKPFARRVALFPHFLPNYMIVVKPNLSNKIEIPAITADRIEKYDNFEDVENGGCCFERCLNARLDPKIVKHTKDVIAKKNKVTEFDEIKKTLSRYENNIQDIDKTLKEILRHLK